VGQDCLVACSSADLDCEDGDWLALECVEQGMRAPEAVVQSPDAVCPDGFRGEVCDNGDYTNNCHSPPDVLPTTGLAHYQQTDMVTECTYPQQCTDRG
jgi:hypothetical protein